MRENAKRLHGRGQFLFRGAAARSLGDEKSSFLASKTQTWLRKNNGPPHGLRKALAEKHRCVGWYFSLQL